ncbi:MAG TPA: formate dehydrogenase accessory protein FdhE [Deltaproteobacteria bacterium]|nr:formate dehydrogenase accessory protein FdhE [Deltaproteobacteria bacterium]
MTVTLSKSLKTIESYKTTSPHYAELLDIMADILISREEYRKNMKDSVFHVEEKLIMQKMEGGLPLVDISSKQYDLSRPRKYFKSLINIAEKRMPDAGKKIMDFIESSEFDWEEMIKASFGRRDDEAQNIFREEQTDSSRSDEKQHSFDLIDLFAEESLRPELEVIAEKYGAVVEKAGWSEGYCPICGKEPKIGEIRESEEGRRYLFCHQCGFKWNYRRIKCPFCGNDEQHSLAYFTVEGEESQRVDVCNKCRRYIKIIELPKSIEELNLDVEDIATLHLDMIAYDEGYD